MCISIYSASQLSLFETPTFISHTCSTRAHIYMLSSPHSSIVMDMNGANSSICRDTMHALHRNLVYIPPPSLSLSSPHLSSSNIASIIMPHVRCKLIRLWEQQASPASNFGWQIPAPLSHYMISKTLSILNFSSQKPYLKLFFLIN